MLVRAKTRDIAILRTMGATRGAIMRIFLIAGLVSAYFLYQNAVASETA